MSYVLDQYGVIYKIEADRKILVGACPHSREEAQKIIDLANDCERVKDVLRAMGAKEKA